MMSRRLARLQRMTHQWGLRRKVLKTTLPPKRVRKSRGWRPPAFTWQDHCGVWRLPARDLHGRIRRLKKRGLPVRLGWHEETYGYKAIEMTALPGFVNLCTRQEMHSAAIQGQTYHVSLCLAKHLPHGKEPLADPSAYPDLHKALAVIRSVLVTRPTTTLEVLHVSKRTSVAYVRIPALQHVQNKIDFVRRRIGGHSHGATVSL